MKPNMNRAKGTKMYKLTGEATGLKIGQQVFPIRFRDVTPAGAKEKDLEDLIVAHPWLLNRAESESGEIDLLIISRQPRNKNGKRADVFAIDQSGFLLTFELATKHLEVLRGLCFPGHGLF